MADTTVKLFQSTDVGAPVINGVAGSLVTLLDACLVNGYNSITLDSLVVSSEVATATKSTGHGFVMAGATGPVALLAGAGVSAINGEQRIVSVPTSTTFTFACPGVPDGSVSGTITCKRAGAGWSILYTGTNKRIYSRASPATQVVLRFDDSYGTYALPGGGDSASGIDGIVNHSWNTYNFRCYKSANANSTAKTWLLAADSTMMYFVTQDGGGLAFGDFESFFAGDQWNTALHCGSSGSTGPAMGVFQSSGITYGPAVIQKAWGQSGAPIIGYRQGLGLTKSVSGHQSNNTTYPSPLNNGAIAEKMLIVEGSTVGVGPPRGLMRGSYATPHYFTSFTQGQILTNFAFGGVVRDLMVFRWTNSSTSGINSLLIDITGPW